MEDHAHAQQEACRIGERERCGDSVQVDRGKGIPENTAVSATLAIVLAIVLPETRIRKRGRPGRYRDRMESHAIPESA